MFLFISSDLDIRGEAAPAMPARSVTPGRVQPAERERERERGDPDSGQWTVRAAWLARTAGHEEVISSAVETGL